MQDILVYFCRRLYNISVKAHLRDSVGGDKVEQIFFDWFLDRMKEFTGYYFFYNFSY